MGTLCLQRMLLLIALVLRKIVHGMVNAKNVSSIMQREANCPTAQDKPRVPSKKAKQVVCFTIIFSTAMLACVFLHSFNRPKRLFRFLFQRLPKTNPKPKQNPKTPHQVQKPVKTSDRQRKRKGHLPRTLFCKTQPAYLSPTAPRYSQNIHVRLLSLDSF